jgi:CheY-like chemotaxis protein
MPMEGGQRDPDDPFGPEPSTTDRLATLRASGEVLEGVLREARELSADLRKRIESDQRLAGRLVLVADDVGDTRDMYVEALCEAGFRVVEARDGREAIEMAVEALPDIIVMDYAMPRMDGAEAVRRLLENQRTQAIPVVMVSAYADELPRYARLTCAAFLGKPCGPEELARLLRLVLDARAPAP